VHVAVSYFLCFTVKHRKQEMSAHRLVKYHNFVKTLNLHRFTVFLWTEKTKGFQFPPFKILCSFPTIELVALYNGSWLELLHWITNRKKLDEWKTENKNYFYICLENNLPVCFLQLNNKNCLPYYSVAEGGTCGLGSLWHDSCVYHASGLTRKWKPTLALSSKRVARLTAVKF